MDKNCKTYIILINYNSYNYTLDCVNSLKKSVYQNFNIIILDNNSDDNSGKKLADKYFDDPYIEVIQLHKNMGFTGGNNYAIQRALSQNANAVLLLNNDTEVDKNFLDNILSEWDNKTVRTPRINYFYDKDLVWYASGKFSTLRGIVYNGLADKNTYVNFASGCCMLLSRYVLEKVGFLDDALFMYYEDVDYCLRIKKAGINIEYIANALIYHKVGKSSGGKKSLSIYYCNRNRFYIIKKHKLGLICKIYTFITRILRIIAAPFNGSEDWVILEAWKDFKRGAMGKNPKY